MLRDTKNNYTCLNAISTPMHVTLSSPGSLKPPLKWAGGKRWLIPILKEISGNHKTRRLVEPCVGGMAVALGLQPEKALLNDANVHLINFFQWLQKGLSISMPMENDEGFYYRCRERFNKLAGQGGEFSQEAAQLFYYLNRTGFNGLCRFNNKGEFNVPFGRYKTINYVTDFFDYSPALSKWDFRCGDFETLDIRPNDFIYADPPYDVEFTKYSTGDFVWSDQVRLAEFLAKHPGPLVLSNQATVRILSLYQGLGFEVKILDAPRRISCTGDRTPAKEVLAYKGV